MNDQQCKQINRIDSEVCHAIVYRMNRWVRALFPCESQVEALQETIQLEVFRHMEKVMRDLTQSGSPDVNRTEVIFNQCMSGISGRICTAIEACVQGDATCALDTAKRLIWDTYDSDVRDLKNVVAGKS